MMNLFLTLVLLALCCTSVWCSQPTINKKSERERPPQTTSKPQLQLTTEVVKAEYYCWNSLKLDLRLTFRNVGRVPIILSKRSLQIASFKVSGNLERSAAKQYELQARYEDFGDSAIFDPPVTTDFFIILPGGKYEMESDRACVHLNVYSGNSTSAEALLAGDHLLEIVVGTWLYIAVEDHSRPQIQDAQFREEWKDKGFLWSDSLTSLAMPFKVDKDRISKCVN